MAHGSHAHGHTHEVQIQTWQGQIWYDTKKIITLIFWLALFWICVCWPVHAAFQQPSPFLHAIFGNGWLMPLVTSGNQYTGWGGAFFWIFRVLTPFLWVGLILIPLGIIGSLVWLLASIRECFMTKKPRKHN